jgi:hypothetical protein
MEHAKIGNRIVGSNTMCRLLGITQQQLRREEMDGNIRQISERDWFEVVYARMEQEAAAMYHAGRREPLTDAEVLALWNEVVAKMRAEEEEIFTAEVTGTELAEFVGVSDRWIRQMAHDGILPQNENGTYPLAHALACFMNYKTGRR